MILLGVLSFFDRKTSEVLGTHHLQATVTMWFLNIWDNVPMDLKYVCQQYFTYMCFLGFIRYNKTFISCGFRKYEIVFTHEYHIPLGQQQRPKGIWYSWVNKFSYFPHQHTINVYMYVWAQLTLHIKYVQLKSFLIILNNYVKKYVNRKTIMMTKWD
jgi:hypothetical protein